MFANFIYLIIALLLYSTYQPTDTHNFGPIETLFLFFGFSLLYAYASWNQFNRLALQVSRDSYARLDHAFNRLLTRYSILAIALFAIDLYALHIPAYILQFPIFSKIPTVAAVCFLCLFILYLAILWTCAHTAYRRIYAAQISRRAYVWSQISFSLPILLPWLVLSGTADFIQILPFPQLKAFLATIEGEVSFFMTFLLLVAIIGPFMIQKFWRCKPLEQGIERSRIEKLCQKANLKYANILYWPIFGGRMVTAGVMGLVKRFRYILVTEALLRLLMPEEIDAVIAHEIGHVKRKHMIFYLVFFAGYMLVSFALLDLVKFAIFYIDPLFSFFTQPSPNQLTLNSILFSSFFILIFLIYFRYIFGYFMRNFERQADCYVYELFNSARPLMTTLDKIAVTSGMSPDRPNWHHFSIAERIGFLSVCENDRSHIKRHDRKIQKSIVIYFVAMLLLGGVGYSLNFGDMGARLEFRLNDKLVKENCQALIDVYEKAYISEPNNLEILNNLAWFYATCDVSLRNPQRALSLALKAASMAEEAHILDTLAESYYINGMVQEAIDAETRALRVTRKHHFYYKEQLQKFKQAAERNELE